MNKKTIAIISVLAMVFATAGVTVVSARGIDGLNDSEFLASIFNDNGPSVDELIETYEDIKEAKEEQRQLMESYGIELPDLSLDEKRELVKTAKQLWKRGYSRNEIRDEIIDLLIGFGVDLPDLTSEQQGEIRSKVRTHLEIEYGFVFVELTPEQKAYMKQTLFQLKRDGKNKEEIKAELVVLYENYGGVIPELTDDEKENIHDWIVSMLENDYNLDLPDLTLEQRENLKNKKEEIRSIQKELRNQIKQANWFNRFKFFRYVKNDLSE